MVRCATTHSTRSTHRRTPAPYSHHAAIHYSHASSCQTSCHGTKCHSQRVTLRYSHASSLQDARRLSSVRLRNARTISLNSDVKGRHVWHVKILVSCYARGLSRETQGVRHARQHKRDGRTCGAIMLGACLRLCAPCLRRKPLAPASASRFDGRPLTAPRAYPMEPGSITTHPDQRRYARAMLVLPSCFPRLRTLENRGVLCAENCPLRREQFGRANRKITCWSRSERVAARSDEL